MDNYKFNSNEWMSLLILSNDDSEVFNALTNDPAFDPENMNIKLEVNGHSVLSGDFNKTLEVWSQRIEDQIKEELDYLSSEQAVKDKAEEIVNNLLTRVMNNEH